MGNPYTSVAISGYNANPPSNDASEISSNQLDWALQHKAKLGDPLKNLAEGINTNTAAAFGKRFGTTFELKTTNYNIAAPGDQGKFFSVTGTTTITLPLVADAGEGFPVVVINNGSGTVTVETTASELIDGSTSFTLAANEWALLTTDANTWTAGIVTIVVPFVDPKTRKVKTADTDRASTTTLEDDPHLAGFSLSADTYYKLEANIQHISNVGDLKWQFQISNAFQANRYSWHDISATGTTLQDNAGSVGALVTINPTNNVEYSLRILGFFKSNATTGGTLDFQWAQNISDANNTTLQDGSWMEITKLS